MIFIPKQENHQNTLLINFNVLCRQACELCYAVLATRKQIEKDATMSRSNIAVISVLLFVVGYGFPVLADEPDPGVEGLIVKIENQLGKLRDAMRTQIGIRTSARQDGAGEAENLAQKLIESTNADIAKLEATRNLLRTAAVEAILMKALLDSLDRADQNHSESAALAAAGDRLRLKMENTNRVIEEEARRRSTGADPLAMLVSKRADGAAVEPAVEPAAEPSIEDGPPLLTVPAAATPAPPPPPFRPAPWKITKGDRIIAINEVNISTVAQFYKQINQTEGATINLVLARGSTFRAVSVSKLNRYGPIRTIGFQAARRPGTTEVLISRIIPTPKISPEESLLARTYR
jgi:hypothetical protein